MDLKFSVNHHHKKMKYQPSNYKSNHTYLDTKYQIELKFIHFS